MNQTVQNLSHRSKVAANCIVLKDGANVPAPQHRKKGYEQFVSESIISSPYFWTPAEHSFHFGFNITTFLLQGRNRKKGELCSTFCYTLTILRSTQMCELDIWKAATLFIGNWMPCIKAGEEAWDKEDNDTSETCEPARRRIGRQKMLQVKATFMQHKTTWHMYRNFFDSLVKKCGICNLIS